MMISVTAAPRSDRRHRTGRCPGALRRAILPPAAILAALAAILPTVNRKLALPGPGLGALLRHVLHEHVPDRRAVLGVLFVPKEEQAGSAEAPREVTIAGRRGFLEHVAKFYERLTHEHYSCALTSALAARFASR